MIDRIVKDSSIWRDSVQFSAHDAVDSTVKIGIIRGTTATTVGYLRYNVEIFLNGHVYLLACDMMTRFGGVYNYEEYGVQAYKSSGGEMPIDPDPYTAYELRAGDTVLVACIGGNWQNGIILGGMPHPARKPVNDVGDVAYSSRFNGVETTITTDGEWRITNMGLPLVPLSAAVPGAPIPEYSGSPMAGNYISITPDGSFEISDNGKQTITIDKDSNTTTFEIDQTTVTIGGSDQEFTVDNKATTFTSSDTFDVESPETSIKASTSCKIKGEKVAIGNSQIELVDAIIQLIDLIGTLVVTSPNGPCNPPSGAAQWPQIDQLKSKISSLKTSL